MTEHEMATFLDENRAAFLMAAREAVVAKITDTMKWNLPDVVHQEVTKFLTAEIAPEVARMLKEEKGAIVEAARVAALGLSKALSEKMMEAAIKNVNGYQGREIFKALFAS